MIQSNFQINHSHVLNQERAQKKQLFFLVTIPKSGSHLLEKILQLFGIEYGDRFFHFLSQAWERKGPFYKNRTISIIGHIKPQHRYFINIRDPRDNLISYVNHVAKHVFSKNVDQISLDEKLDAALCTGKYKQTSIHFLNRRFFAEVNLSLQLKQAKLKNVLVVKFEDIVRPKAGGANNGNRFQTFKEIAHFGKVSPDNKKIFKVMEQCWGGTESFKPETAIKVRKWEKIFKPRHILAFKEKYNHLLLGLGYETDPNWDLKYLNSQTNLHTIV